MAVERGGQVPPRWISDPELGVLLFMFMPSAPDLSYWTCEHPLRGVGQNIRVELPGREGGPDSEARRFYLDLQRRFDKVLSAATRKRARCAQSCLKGEARQDLFSILKVTTIRIENANNHPARWSIIFNTRD